MKSKSKSQKNLSETFIKIPLSFLKRKDISPATKLVIGYIFTRANINEINWTVSSADIEKNTGLSHSMVYYITKDAESNSILKFKCLENNGKTKYPTRIYDILKDKDSVLKSLQKYQSTKPYKKKDASESHSTIERSTHSTIESESVQPLNGSPIQLLTLEEDSNKKILKEDGTKEEAKLGENITTESNKAVISAPVIPTLEIPVELQNQIEAAHANLVHKETCRQLQDKALRGKLKAGDLDAVFKI